MNQETGINVANKTNRTMSSINTKARPVSNRMKLLICAQAVDRSDPILGFFHGWLEEFAKRFERVVVVCLRTGEHSLPENVEVVSLGGGFRLQRALEVCSIAFGRREDYDAVFVHMSQEFVLAAGWLWKLLGKRVYLWRNHYAGSFLTELAAFFCTKIFCTSKRSYTAKYRKIVLMPVGVDTRLFKPSAEVPRTPRSVLFLGRLAPSKRPELLIEALGELRAKSIDFKATICGPGEAGYIEDLKRQIAELDITEQVAFAESVSHVKAPGVYSMHELFVNLSPSGMLDKTLFEASACGALVLATSEDFAELVGGAALSENAKEIAKRIERVFELSPEEKKAQSAKLRSIAESHDVRILIERLQREMDI